MKKLVFTAQVVGLIAMFPLVVFLELNKGPEGSFKNISPSNEPQKSGIHSQGNAKHKAGNEVFSSKLENPLIKKIF